MREGNFVIKRMRSNTGWGAQTFARDLRKQPDGEFVYSNQLIAKGDSESLKRQQFEEDEIVKSQSISGHSPPPALGLPVVSRSFGRESIPVAGNAGWLAGGELLKNRLSIALSLARGQRLLCGLTDDNEYSFGVRKELIFLFDDKLKNERNWNTFDRVRFKEKMPFEMAKDAP